MRRVAKEYGWPQFGSRAELKSLVYHCKLRTGLSVDGPPAANKEKTLKILEDMYSAVRWSIPQDFMTKEHFYRVLQKLDWTSSPGYPYMLEGTTNRDYFRVDDPEKFAIRAEKMWRLVQLKIQGELGPDHIRLFIKSEPLKLAKLEKSKYRLISSVSVADSIIDLMVFGEHNDVMVKNCLKIPNKAGWSVYGGGWKTIPRETCYALDKSGWDWSAHIWLFEMELELRKRLCDNFSVEWWNLAQMRYKQLFVDPTFVNSGGYVFRQKYPGVMKSGCQNTISTNSNMQIILHVSASVWLNVPVTDIMAMGDDTLQLEQSDWTSYLTYLSKYCIVKHVNKATEFCGVAFEEDRVEPLYRGKHAFNLLHMDPAFGQEIANSYVLMYHRSKYRRFMEELFKSLGYKVPEPLFRDIIFDGDD